MSRKMLYLTMTQIGRIKILMYELNHETSKYPCTYMDTKFYIH